MEKTKCSYIKPLIMAFIALAAILIAASQVYAASSSTDTTVVSRVTDEFFNRSQQWSSKLESSVKDLFVLCFTLELVMLGLTALIKREALEDIFSNIIMAALFGGFIMICIVNYNEWSNAIMVGLTNYTGLLGYDSKSIIVDPLDKGFELFKHITYDLSSWSRPMDSLAFILVGFAILVSFALLTIQIIYVKCEAFVAVGAGFILLGFGGCKFFKDYALNLMRYILSVGFKLYMLYVVLGLGFAFIRDSIHLGQNFTLQDLAVILVTALILLSLSRALPDVAAGIIQGSSVNTGGTMMSTIRTVGGLAAAGAVAAWKKGGQGIGAVKNLRSAAKVARGQGRSGMGMAVGTLKAMRQAGKQAKLDSPNAPMGARVGSKLEAMKEAQKTRRG